MFFTPLIWFRNVYKISSCCWFCIYFWIKWELWKTFDAKMIGWTHFSNSSLFLSCQMGLSDAAFFMIKHTLLPNGNHPILSPICPIGVADMLELRLILTLVPLRHGSAPIALPPSRHLDIIWSYNRSGHPVVPLYVLSLSPWIAPPSPSRLWMVPSQTSTVAKPSKVLSMLHS